MTVRTTTVLGVKYVGRPMMGSLACDLWLYQRRGQHKKARALLDATNRMRAAFDQPPIDLTDQFTTAPLEGLMRVPAGRLRDEDFDDAPKDCPSCGEVLENGSCAVGCLDELKRTGTGGWL